MRKSLVLLSVALLAALAGRGVAAPSHGSPVNSGDKLLGTIDSPADRDLFRITAPDGARLEVVVKAARKSALLPDLGLLDPAGNPVDLKMFVAGLTSPTVSIPVLGIHETGEWTVAVSGYQGTTGAYQAVVRVVTEPKVRTTVTVPARTTMQQHFVGVTGARVDYTVVETEGPGLDRAEICCPADRAIPGTAAARAGTRLRGRKIVLDRGGGLYGIEMTNSSWEPTVVEITTVVRFPKVKTKKVSLGTEPRPAVMSPWSGRNGTPFVLTGSGFAAGAKVVFADSDEAADVLWISATEMRGVAPECAASRDGDSVPVSVLNPDGQYGSTASGFAFIGIPAPDAFAPKLSPLEGGVTVSVSGVRFREGFTVEVGGVPSPSVTCLTPSHLTFTTPAAPAGVYGVVVRDEFGRAAADLPGMWYSDTPDVTSADPPELSSIGGVTVTLAGTGLVPGVRVFVGGTEAALLSQDPPTALSFRCPPAHSGAVEVEVRDPLGRSFRGDLLSMSRALHDESDESLPPAPPGADFRGDLVSLGDTNGDGLPEILVTSRARWTNPQNGQFMPGSFLLENTGAGAFTDSTTNVLPLFNLPGDDGQGDAALMGDLDGNGRDDVALVRASVLPAADPFISYGGFKGYYEIPDGTSFDPATVEATRLLMNNGSGLLRDDTAARVPGNESTPVLGKGERWQGRAAVLGDLDGDGDGDLILISGQEVDRGTVTRVAWTYKYVYYGYPYYYTRRLKDQAVISQEATPTIAMRVLENDGYGFFYHESSDDPAPVLSQAGEVLDDFRGTAVAAGDLDGDGMADAVVVGAVRTRADDGSGGVKDAPALRVLLNDGSGGFRLSPGSIPGAPGTALPASDEWWQGGSLALGDFDADGDLDIAVGRVSVRSWIDPGSEETMIAPALRLFRNDGRGVFAEDTGGFLSPDLTTRPTARTMLGVSSMAAVDIDGDGDTDLVATGRVTTPVEPIIPGGGRMCTRILLNDGEAGLRDATADWLADWDFLPSDGLAAGDLDGDGTEDLVLVLHGSAGEGKRSLRVLKNK